MTLALETAKKLQDDHTLYASKLLKIKTKTGELVKFKHNAPQKKIQKMVDKLESEGKPVRLLFLKARQQGVSTWAQAQAFRRTSTQANTNGLVIAHEAEATDNLFSMSKLFYEQMPTTLTFSDGSSFRVKPKQRYSNRKELVFADLNSQLRVATAGTKESGRSATLRVLHCSEVAFWDNAEETMLALLQALSDDTGTFAAIESTANGVGGFFYDLWQDAKAGKNEWIPIFLAWFELDEYSRPFSDEQEKLEFLQTMDLEEQNLQDTYFLTLEQLHWRRWTIANKCGGDVNKFRQEYPANDSEAFLTSGRPYFNRQALSDARANLKRGQRGILSWVGTPGKSEVEFLQDPAGYVEVWQHPDIKKGCYAIGGDVAEGLEHGDYSTGQVLDRDTGEQVAEWHGHIDPDLLADELVKLATYYNKAWLGIEVNRDGITTNKKAQELKYSRLYMRQTAPDKKDIKATDKLGWWTGATTRPVMLNDLATAIREQNLIIRGEGLLNECVTFVIDSKGKPQAQEGCFDDRVMAMAIALQVHQTCPMSRPVNEQERKARARRRQRRIKASVSDITGY